MTRPGLLSLLLATEKITESPQRPAYLELQRRTRVLRWLWTDSSWVHLQAAATNKCVYPGQKGPMWRLHLCFLQPCSELTTQSASEWRLTLRASLLPLCASLAISRLSWESKVWAGLRAAVSFSPLFIRIHFENWPNLSCADFFFSSAHSELSWLQWVTSSVRTSTAHKSNFPSKDNGELNMWYITCVCCMRHTENLSLS